MDTFSGDDAVGLVQRSFVFQTTERSRSPRHPDRMLNDPLELDAALIDEWRAAGVDAVGAVTFANSVEPHSGMIDQLGRWNAVLAGHPRDLVRISSAADIELATASGRIGVLLVAHTGDQFREVDDVDLFHDLGLRSCLITHNAQNRIGSAAEDRRDTGLSSFGVAIVERMNSVGMAIDVTHASEQTAMDVLEHTAAPILLGHTNAYRVCPNVKNKSDAVLRAVAEASGFMGISAVRPAVGTGEVVTVENLLDHIDHIAELCGIRHVGLGFEAPVQGYDRLPGAPTWPAWVPPGSRLDLDGFVDVDRLALLTDGLIRRGYSDDEIAGVLGLNAARVIADIFEAGRRKDTA